MGRCSNCGVYAHNIRTCPEVVRKNKSNNAVVKTFCKTKKSCLVCSKKGHTFDMCEEFERIIPEYCYTEAPSPIYPTQSIEDVWIDVM
jgi:hypothetical protein